MARARSRNSAGVVKQRGVLIGGIPLPFEPFYRLATVAELLDIHLSYLYRLLSIHRARFPARYRRDGRHPRNVRVLTASEVRRLYRSEEHTSELQSHSDLVCRLLLEKKK